MTSARNYLVAGFAVQIMLTGLVLLIIWIAVDADGKDLTLLAMSLLLTGLATLALGFVARHRNVPRLVRSIRGQLVAASALTATLALANVGIVAALMFLSNHDLIVLAVLIVFALGMSVFVSFSFSETIAGSVRQLIEAVRRVNAGALDARVAVGPDDEIGELGRAFNEMAERLEDGFGRERDLEHARRDLITAVSHDLRTPLASIRAMVESINDGVVKDGTTVARYLLETQSEIERVSELIDDLFELSRLDAGTLELHHEQSSIYDLVSDTLQGMAAQAASHQLTLEGSVSPYMPAVVMDTPRVQRVLDNLVQNAIRHTPPDGTISIHASDAGSKVEIQVIDTGEGMPEGDLSQIFDRFYRGDRSRSLDSRGAGLGLSIAKGIVEAHGGRIWARSSVDRGSVFSFTLPKVPVTTR